MSAPVFTEEDVRACWRHHLSYFVDILNGEYALEEAREDLRGLIGSAYDPRSKKEAHETSGN